MANFIANLLRTQVSTLGRKAVALAAVGVSALLLSGVSQAQVQVTLSSATLPSTAQPGLQSVRITGSQFPAGTIAAGNITVSLTPATPSAGPGAETAAAGFARVAGTTATVTFVVPTSVVVTTPVAYLVSISGTTSTGTAFASSNTSNLTIEPSASVGVSPSSGQQGQTLAVNLAGSYTSFAQGVTTANFGPGIAVGGAAEGAAGPVAVTSATTATAELVIDPSAATGPRSVVVTSGTQQSLTGFNVTAATQNIDLSITKSHVGNFTQGQTGAYSVVVSNGGPGATSGAVTVVDTLPTGLSLNSMTGSGWSCGGTSCTRSDSLASGLAYPAITVSVAVAANAPTTVTNSVAVSGGGTDSNTSNNMAMDPTTVVQVPASITATAGTPQSAAISTAFAAPLQVTVKDAGGNPVSGVVVTFAAPGAGASGSFAGGLTTATTNGSGVATSAAFTANATAGSYSVTASVSGVGTAASFSLTNTAGAAASITATAGTPQSAAISTAFAAPLQVTVKDAGGNPVSGVVVTFAAPGSGASGSFAGGLATATTNGSGVATSATFTANATAGSYSVTASVSGVGTAASFSLTNTAGAAASITATAGTPQSAAISTAFAAPLQVTVKDAGGNPVSGVVVTFAAPGTGASGSFAGGANTAMTNASGVATSAIFTANATAGSYSVTASVSGVGTAASFSLTNTAGAAASITATAGTPQSAAISTAFAAPLQVTVKDAGGNPVSGVVVTFAAPGSGASGSFAGGLTTATTNGSGVATSAIFTANATAGSYSVMASVSGVGTPASFSLTNTAGAAASITATAGTPQSAAISTAFAAPLQVTVKDAGGNPVNGVVVTFAAPGAGASGSFAGGLTTATTNGSGVATSAIFTANATAGSYSVTASVSGVGTAASFSLTNTAGAAASITATAGTPQSTQVNTAFTTDLQVLVKDAGGNAVPNAAVTFTSPSASDGSFGGSLTANVNTNGSGYATAPAFTASSTAGSYSVTATVSGVGTPASFSLTNTAAAAASITATAGSGQSATVGTAFATNLQATVKDGSNNPVSGATVTFTSPSTNYGTFAGGGTSVNETTNASGVATATVFTAGTTAGAYSVTATVSGVGTPASFSLTNTAGTANSISVYSGSGQSVIINTAFPSHLVAIVRDSDNNVVSGATVTFTVPNSGASGTFAGGVLTVNETTDVNGLATSPVFTANATAGAYSVSASVSGASTPANFSLTNTSGTPNSVTTYSGATQSTPTGTAFATNLAVVVRDSGNNGVNGVIVTFTAPSSGASGTFANGTITTTATTDSNGIATASTFTANGIANSYQVTASVSGVSTPAAFTLTNTQAIIASLSPTSGALAQTLDVAVTGTSTHFVQGTTTAYFGTGITVNTVTVSNLTAATVNITIAPTTTLGDRTVTMTTGSEVATDTNAFDVTQGSATILSVTPSSGAQGTQENVAVVGSATNFAQGVTTASFGPNIGINSVMVTDLTHATVNISISGNATVEKQTVTLTTGGEIASLSNGFSVTAGTAEITTVNPNSGNQGDTADTIAITGQSTHFVQGTTTASFGPGITVTSLTVNGGTSATAVIAIDSGAAIGNRTVTLTTGSEIASSSPTAFSVAAGVPSATANPNFGVQGTNPTIVINGSFTGFVAGTTTVSFGDPYITVGTVTVNGPTQLSVPIQISTNATVGPRTITMNTNGNIVQAAFSVAAGMPAITVISPNTGVANSTATVTVSGNFTNWQNTVTTANFGAGIAVGGGAEGQPGPVTVNNTGNLTASLTIDPSATVGPRTVTVTTGSEVETVNSGFTVEACTATAASVILYSPAINAANVPLNTNISVEFNSPINRSTVTTSDFELEDTTTGQYIPGTLSVDASGRIVTFTPSVILGVGRSYYLYYGNLGSPNQIKDACGNLVGESYFYFTTAFSAATTGPSLLMSSPQSGDTVAENAQVVLKFSEPINPITQAAGFVVSSGGTPVAGTYTPSTDYTQYTFVPGSAMAASTVYTVTYTSALQDGAGNALTNPGSFTFTTTSSTDTTHGTISFADPFANETGVPTDIQPTVYFSKIVDPITVTTSDFYLVDYTTGRRIPATVAVSADRYSATLTPLQPLQPNTQYYFYIYPVYDISGNLFGASETFFYTGSESSNNGTTVATISPLNTATGTPVNTQVVAVMSASVDPGTITNSSIVVSAGGTPVAGTVTLGSDEMTLTFTPSANLAVSTTYSVAVSGFLDSSENPVTAFASSFTTGSSGTAQTSHLTLVSATPANSATGVANSSPITLTFSAAVDPATINNILVRDQSDGYYEISGSWALNGSNPAQVIFTPTTPYPALAVIQVYTQDEVEDLAGNTDTAGVATTFTAANVADTSTFQVVSISPANGTTGVGRNATVAITFNKSVNRSSISGSTNSLQVFQGDQNISSGCCTYSSDGRTITFIPSSVSAGETINILATPLITDLSGNPLVNFASSYQTGNDITGTSPAVTQMLPANGSSDVLLTTPITLYTNGASLNPETVNSGTLYVSQNGALVQGTIQVASNGQSVTFTPASAFSYGALVQVFVESGVTDIYGNPFTTYTAQFRTQGNPSTIAPQVVGYNPTANATNVPTNVLPQIKFDQQLLPSSVNSSSVELYANCTGQQIPGSAAVIGDGTILQYTPANALPATCNGNPAEYILEVNYSSGKVTNVDGVAVSGNPYSYFTVGAGPATSAPTVLSVAPPAGATNVGVNAVVYVQFSEKIDPLSVNGTTVQLTSGAQTAVPQTIAFDTTGTYAILQPELPLPANAPVTITVTGVTDFAGNAVTPYSSTFQTAAGPITARPLVLSESVPSGTTSVPTNASFTVQFNETMAANSFTGSTFYLIDNLTGLTIPTNISVSADGTAATLTPVSQLAVNRQYYYYASSGLRDVTGNSLGNYDWYFTTQSTPSAVTPQVTTVDPANNATNVATNVVVELLFNEPISPDSVSQVTLSQGGTPIPVTPSLSRNNTVLSLTPSAILQANTAYTITAANVVDFAGNVQTGTFSSSFTTGASFDVTHGSISSTIPESSAPNVALNVQPTFYFTRQVNPISVYPGMWEFYNYQTGANVLATATVAANQMSVTLTPTENLQPNTEYYVYLETTYDVTGNSIGGSAFIFYTGSAPATAGASVASISPANGQTGLPLNTQIVAVMSAPVSQSTFGSSPITVQAGATVVPGTTTLGSDLMTMTFTPSANLVASTTYTVNVGGFEDENGNTVQSSSSSFTTGTTAETGGAFKVLSETPASGTTLSSNTTPVVLTFSEPLDPSTINNGNVLVRDQTESYDTVAGSWSVSGATATFTPLSPYPANHVIQVYVQGLVLDEAGESTSFSYTFTAANSTDTTAPTVTSVTPMNGATSVGTEPTIVLTFSKSMNTQSLNTTSVAVFAGDTQFSYSLTFPANGNSVSIRLNTYLPASTVITVAVSSAATDLSGDALTPFQSQFTTAAAQPSQSQAPEIASQIPAIGASDVSQGTPITLYTTGTAISTSTVNSSSVQVAVNGQLVSGTATLIGDGHAIQFTPTNPFAYGGLVQIFVSQSVTDVDGYSLQSAYSGQFTVQKDPASNAAAENGTNPFANATGVAPNVLPQMRFDQQILAGSLNASSVKLMDACNGTSLAGTASVVNGNIVQFTPSADLPSASCTQYYLQLYGTGANQVTNADGVAISGTPYFYFYTGTTDDHTNPTVTALGPPSGTQNVGINAEIYVQFSKPINPLSVTGSTIAITGASQTVMPATISFDSTYDTAIIQPSEPLPPSATMTITINGVTDPEGNPVVNNSSTFQTAPGPITTRPTVVAASFNSGDTIPLNTTAFSVTFSGPMDPLSVTPSAMYVYDYRTEAKIAGGTVTASSDMTTFTLTLPAGQLDAGDEFYLYVTGALDISGNTAGAQEWYGYIGSTNDTTPPAVTEVNPETNLTGVPTNVLPQVEFSQEISSVSAQMGIQLLQGGNVVPATITLSRGNTVATITPSDPLSVSTIYTVSANGVQNVQGTAMASPYTSNFTTSANGINLAPPTLVSVTPASGTIGVAATVTPTVVFSAAMDPLTFDASLAYAEIKVTSTGVVVPTTVSFSPDGKTVTFTPTSALTSGTTYTIYLNNNYLTDVAGVTPTSGASSTTFTVQ